MALPIPHTYEMTVNETFPDSEPADDSAFTKTIPNKIPTIRYFKL